MTVRPLITGSLCLALAACTEVMPEMPRLGLNQPEITLESQPGPPGAPEGSCWGKSIRPAVIETVQEQILVQPAQVQNDGTVLSPAIYRTEKQQRIVQARHETWFETPCPNEMTPDFLASLQRALKARGAYRGQITGVLDNRTRAAIRRYQSAYGLDSQILSLETGRQLGLIEVARDID